MKKKRREKVQRLIRGTLASPYVPEPKKGERSKSHTFQQVPAPWWAGNVGISGQLGHAATVSKEVAPVRPLPREALPIPLHACQIQGVLPHVKKKGKGGKGGHLDTHIARRLG